MNAKKCKQLRKMAHAMCLQPDGTAWPYRKLMVHPAHELKAREYGMQGVSAVNSKQSFRGVYQWLKKEHAND